ncbi:MAG: hypothetical protein A3K19_15425 [Lentisphaerae bacterium RIFOXYB12_FULL_65_16]|nr:MAG: hypothetical protein A3K18_26520 [Lentisphaerae bacterium RIFOXYA12_64_32]OGV88490.1 MAG: hypothetical protein A3K19_15425 [Lentisphaerae bacterium RIFOXYB12_FULL_65_16]
MAEYLKNLTESQRQAVTHVDGPLLVVAGAGSGKTRVVTFRIAHLISRGVWPGQILAMTFTNKAAGEMQERVRALAGDAPRWVGTFHSACARFLRQDLDKLPDGRTSQFTIYDQDDQTAIVKHCIKTLKLEERGIEPRPTLALISNAKNSRISPGAFRVWSREGETVQAIYQLYEDTLRQMNAVDFDDLLILTVRLLEEVPHLRDIYHSRFRYVLIDEYQDTNTVQYDLLKLLTGPTRNVHLTGDPDQSIYSWRGADFRNINRFLNDFPDALLVRLEQNYRSTQTVLTAANELIRHNSERIDKELFTDNGAGVPIRVVRAPSEREEAAWVAERVVTLRLQGIGLSDMAVFYRTNAQSRAFEEVLMRVGIPYQILGGIRFYERKEVKDLLAHLKLLVNPRDIISLERIVECRPTGVGQKTLADLIALANRRNEPVFTVLQRPDFVEQYDGRVSAKLAAFAGWCRELGQVPLTPVGECVRAILIHSGLLEYYRGRADKDPLAEDRIENLKAFAVRAAEFEEAHPDASLPELLQDVALVADVDNWDRSAETLSLMTLHSAKGLEFPYVFIVGVEEGLLPHQNSREPAQVEEERRLFYVGITRTEQELCVLHAAERRGWRGEVNRCRPSHFLAELPPETVEETDLCFSQTSEYDTYRRGQPRRRQRGEWTEDGDPW